MHGDVRGSGRRGRSAYANVGLTYVALEEFLGRIDLTF